MGRVLEKQSKVGVVGSKEHFLRQAGASRAVHCECPGRSAPRTLPVPAVQSSLDFTSVAVADCLLPTSRRLVPYLDANFTLLTNCRYCLNGQLVDDHLVISEETGRILYRTGYIGGDICDLEGHIVAPGFLELQTYGANGFRFTDFENQQEYDQKLQSTAEYYLTQGVTGFWATIPTVAPDTFQQILPSLNPKAHPSFQGATVLGAHAYNPDLRQTPILVGPSPPPSLKHLTLSPSASTTPLIPSLRNASLTVSLAPQSEGSGSVKESAFLTGISALAAGATGLSASSMPTMNWRAGGDDSLVGLVTIPPSSDPQPPFYGLVADGAHVSPSTAALLFRANQSRAMLVSSADPASASSSSSSSTISLAQSVRNLMAWTGCSVAEAVRCCTENVAAFMGVDGFEVPGMPPALGSAASGKGGPGVGVLKQGRRADLVVLSDEGEVLQTWIAGRKAWEREGGL
ncbi:n-acetylglucosamine-6-phosphate deacetylase-like protein [Phyllosticta citriasiana]|uniref:n-acetylglucosamine-6-phosphate deacetylase-like protein n=1 Tax=Phyllosticta citriasiana TaxID=595635 RepID=UPI0030FD2ED1